MKQYNTTALMRTYRAFTEAEACYNYYKSCRVNGTLPRPDLFDLAESEYNAALDDYLTQQADLNKIIREEEGRATERTIHANMIAEFLDRLDDYLYISKKDREGITIGVDLNHQSFARAYKYTPYATQFTAEYRRGTWWITEIGRGVCKRTECYINHTDASRAALLRRFEKFNG